MKTLLVNDTSNWHAGSAACVQAIREQLGQLGHEVWQTVPNRAPGKLEFPELVVVNGEGSMHHSGQHPPAKWLLGVIAAAKAAGSKVWLVNSLWDSMTPSAADTVRECVDYFQVREIASAREARFQGLSPVVQVDASAAGGWPLIPGERSGVATDETWDLKDGLADWGCLLADLERFDRLETRYHHGVIAGLLTHTPVVYDPPASARPTHKVDGVLEWLREVAPSMDSRSQFEAFDQLPRFSLPLEVPA